MSEIPEAVPNQIPDSLSDEQRQELRQLAENVNSRLFQAGAESAEQAFGLGCVVFALPVLILIAVLFFVQVLNLILALIVLAMGRSGCSWVSSIVSSQRACSHDPQSLFTRYRARDQQVPEQTRCQPVTI